MSFISIPRDKHPERTSVLPKTIAPIEAIAIWCECLQSRQPLLTALRQLGRSLGARSVCLSRHSRDHVRKAQTLTFNEPEIIASSIEVDRSYAHCILGAYIDRSRTGSVWLSSLVDEQNDPSLGVFQRKAGIVETAVIALSVEEKRVDYLELHFAKRVEEQALEHLNMIADALSRIWATRNPGLFCEAILSHREERCVLPMQAHPLADANPAGLSRSEFRICLLLSRGLNRASICHELEISPCTLRTHLRNVFKKTSTGSLAELLFVLLSPSKRGGGAASGRLSKLG